MSRISRRGILRAARNLLIGGGLSVLGVYQYIQCELEWFKLNHYSLRLEGLGPEFDGLRVVHLSDLHFSPIINLERFAEVIEIVQQQFPDLILITGDFIDRDTPREQIPDYVVQLGSLNAKLGVFAVLGNHDHWQDQALVRHMLEESGIKDLSNRVETLVRGTGQLHLCGLDDYMVGEQDLDSVLAALPREGCAILMVHEPDYADISAASGRFALQLSGHSHGGQVYVPFYGPPIVPDHGRKYPRGLYQVGDMTLYTNTGIGVIRPYVRVNCRPEVAVFHLESGLPEI